MLYTTAMSPLALANSDACREMHPRPRRNCIAHCPRPPPSPCNTTACDTLPPQPPATAAMSEAALRSAVPTHVPKDAPTATILERLHTIQGHLEQCMAHKKYCTCVHAHVCRSRACRFALLR